MPNPLTLSVLAEALKQALIDEGGDAFMDKTDSTDNFRIDGSVDLNVVMRALLTTIEKAGYKVVPVEPTEEMLRAVVPWPLHWKRDGHDYAAMRAAVEADRMECASQWTLMLSSSPKIGEE